MKNVKALMLASAIIVAVATGAFAQQTKTTTPVSTAGSNSSAAKTAPASKAGTEAGKPDLPEAVLDKNFDIMIPAAQAIQRTYELNTSQVQFKDADEMENFFKTANGEYATFTVNRTNKKVMMMMHMDKINDKKLNAADINKYFSDKSAGMKDQFAKIDNTVRSGK